MALKLLTAARKRGDHAFVARAEHAIDVYARWDNSNPYARAQVTRDIEMGWALPSQIIEDFEPKLIARQQAIIAEANRLSQQVRSQFFAAA